MYKINNFKNNDDVRVLDEKGAFSVIEYKRDLSVTPSTAMLAFFCNEMNVRKRQLVCDLKKSDVTVQTGAMQWTAGNVNATTGIKGVGDFFGKALRGKVTSLFQTLCKPPKRCRIEKTFWRQKICQSTKTARRNGRRKKRGKKNSESFYLTLM